MSTSRSDAYAVVIGINEYKDRRIRKLQFAQAAAEAMHATLTDPKLGRFKPENVTLLLEEQATERRIRSELNTELPKRASKGGTVFIYYAGHGAVELDTGSGSNDAY